MKDDYERPIGDDVPEVLEKYQIKALPTEYGGIKYRSRIEARWAVFFDALRIEHHYEPEGFDLGDRVLYLPDFWLPRQKCWVDIKGADPEEDACDKASRLAVGSGASVFVFFGGITLPCSEFGAPKAYQFCPGGCGDCYYYWCECPSCGFFGITFDGRSDRLACKLCIHCQYAKMHGCEPTHHACFAPTGCPRTGANLDKGYNLDSPKLVAAYQAARRMRFTR